MFTMRLSQPQFVAMLESAAAYHTVLMERWDTFTFASDLEKNYRRDQQISRHDRRLTVLSAIHAPLAAFRATPVARAQRPGGGLDTGQVDLTLADIEWLGLLPDHFRFDYRLKPGWDTPQQDTQVGEQTPPPESVLEVVDGTRDHL